MTNAEYYFKEIQSGEVKTPIEHLESFEKWLMKSWAESPNQEELMKCGCYQKLKDGNLIIIFCPLHAAAGEMRELLKKVVNQKDMAAVMHDSTYFAIIKILKKID